MMSSVFRSLACLSTLLLVAAVPHHVQTADYWRGYAGTKTVPPEQAARWLSWVETDSYGSAAIAPYGVKTLLYTNPNREQPGDPMYGSQEDMYAHTCSGGRARAGVKYAGQVQTNPGSRALAQKWRKSVEGHSEGGHFDAVFSDDADGAIYAADQPCGYSLNDWLRGETQLQRSLGKPVIYNGLSDFNGHGVAKEIALNASAAGGMLEECYAQLSPDTRVNGWRWIATEETELRMAHDRKYFFCYGRDLTPADQAVPGRMYAYASFLLTYDPGTSVLWEYYKTPSGAHVMPESQLVAYNPVKRSVKTIEQLRTPEGLFERSYRHCYLDARPAGACVVVVNPDDDAHRLALHGYGRTLSLHGSGVFDGGYASIDRNAPPSSVPPRGAVIAFK